MRFLSRLLCLIGQHRRSRGRARPTATGWRSRCRGCGVPMEKVAGGTWHVAAAPPAKGASQPEA